MGATAWMNNNGFLNGLRMKKLTSLLLASGCCVLMASCANTVVNAERPRVPQVKGDPSKVGALSSLTRVEALSIADSFVKHCWTPTQANVLHGPDAHGIRVETPDVTFNMPGKAPGYWSPGEVAVGIPYCWGGMDTPESFDRGIAEGKFAGDVCTDTKRKLLDDGVSAQTCGVDCSGFVSRCWKLTWSCSTRELPFICDELRSFDDLKPGDAVNFENAHVMLVAGFIGGDHKTLAVYQTGSPNSWKCEKQWVTLDWLKKAGYKPWRYRGIK